MITSFDFVYKQLLLDLRYGGNYIVSRGAGVKSLFGYTFGPISSPLVTIRKTAWKTALKELEWFMSGQNTCPEGVLRDLWWKGQLSNDNELNRGYPAQLRHSANIEGFFDQITWLHKEIKNNPTSRRLCLTVWNPGEMPFLKDYNDGNPMVPSSCHLIWNQFQVRDNHLHMNAVFRSTDAVLGLPHNVIQHRALQLYFAHHAGVEAAPYYQLYLNDVHYYDHPDHNAFVDWLDDQSFEDLDVTDNDLIYNATSIDFKADDFSFIEPVSEPLYTKKIERTL
jgi:thymidylate synthase